MGPAFVAVAAAVVIAIIGAVFLAMQSEGPPSEPATPASAGKEVPHESAQPDPGPQAEGAEHQPSEETKPLRRFALRMFGFERTRRIGDRQEQMREAARMVRFLSARPALLDRQLKAFTRTAADGRLEVVIGLFDSKQDARAFAQQVAGLEFEGRRPFVACYPVSCATGIRQNPL